MSKADIDVVLEVNNRMIDDILRVEREVTQLGFRSALFTALHNNYLPVRWVLGRRLARRLGVIDPSIAKLYGYPVAIDKDAEMGFGLVVRPPDRRVESGSPEEVR